MVSENEDERQVTIPSQTSRVYRKRYNYEFITPSIVKEYEEITFYNGQQNTNSVSIHLELSQYRPNLKLYDINGTRFEYYKKDKTNDEFPNKIIIELPKDDPFLSGGYKTVIIENDRTSTDIKTTGVSIYNYLYKGISTHIFVKGCKDYVLDLDYDILGENGELKEITDFYINKENRSFELYASGNQIYNGKVIIDINHKIPSSTLLWYRFGLVYGGTISLLIPYLFYYVDAKSINEYIAIASVTISLLIVIIGWMNQKELVPSLRKYNAYYWGLVVIVFMEILSMIVYTNMLLP